MSITSADLTQPSKSRLLSNVECQTFDCFDADGKQTAGVLWIRQSIFGVRKQASKKKSGTPLPQHARVLGRWGSEGDRSMNTSISRPLNRISPPIEARLPAVGRQPARLVSPGSGDPGSFRPAPFCGCIGYPAGCRCYPGYNCPRVRSTQFRGPRDVAIIRDIQQKLTAGLILNPADGKPGSSVQDQLIRILHQELHIDVLKFHVPFLPLRDADGSQPVVAGMRSVNKKLGLINQIAGRIRVGRLCRRFVGRK